MLTFEPHLGATTFQNTRHDVISKDVPIVAATIQPSIGGGKRFGEIVFPNKRKKSVFYKVVSAEVLLSHLLLLVGHETWDLVASRIRHETSNLESWILEVSPLISWPGIC
ncbi:hypothetical protein NPIL_67771 [Nephila pilipes]|uniref:Uncharacterized protein n=1 Tax=Nephila pilipes TaxID=299642 RepID=A0A8X6Q5U5_NEPPI|nr:hypothetical protein NPIL_67771 [Nephila pilipes]